MLDAETEDTVFNAIYAEYLIMQLTPKQRVIIALILSGYKRIECSQIVGLTHGAVTFIYRQALKRLKEVKDTDDDGTQMHIMWKTDNI